MIALSNLELRLICKKAIDYCQLRISSATMKHQEKHWRKLLREAETAMSERFDTDEKVQIVG